MEGVIIGLGAVAVVVFAGLIMSNKGAAFRNFIKSLFQA